MKFSCSTSVHLSKDQTIALYYDQEHFDKWQDGFKEKKLLEGVVSEVGSKSEILFDQNGRKLELIETILENKLPEYFVGQYDHIHMTNTMKTTFKELRNGGTEITNEIHYTKFHSTIPWLMAKIFPSMFKRQTQKWLDQFKSFAEMS